MLSFFPFIYLFICIYVFFVSILLTFCSCPCCLIKFVNFAWCDMCNLKKQKTFVTLW